jgi:maltose O-acetyltransferase
LGIQLSYEYIGIREEELVHQITELMEKAGQYDQTGEIFGSWRNRFTVLCEHMSLTVTGGCVRQNDPNLAICYQAFSLIRGGVDAMTGKLEDILRSEFGGCHPRLIFAQGLVALLPAEAFIRLRPHLYRLAGIRIGRGTVMSGRVRLTGTGAITRRLVIGNDCYLNENITFNLGAALTLEDNVSVGMDCLFITNTHEMGTADFRAGTVVAKPVRVGRGAWLGARVTVLPGVTIGAGAVVGSGAVVTGDVAANVLAGGIPAKMVRELSPPGPVSPSSGKTL